LLGVMALLMLVSPLYMMQVYGRVLHNRSNL
jgi:ABC-type protease/lipase transport system fused ATPase/permease subunit